MRVVAVVLVVLVGLLAAGSKLTEDMEVAVLTTYQEGVVHHTHIWVVDDESTLWIRAGGTKRQWYRRLVAEPNVELERDELVRGYTAEADPDPRIVARVNRLMREKYGLAGWIFSAIHTWSELMPIRLHPR